jgi:hypothetical protein
VKKALAPVRGHALSYLMPLEDALNALVHKAAASKAAKEAESAYRYAQIEAQAIMRQAARAADDLERAARADYEARTKAAKSLPLVLTSTTAANLVLTASVNIPASPLPA